MKVMLDTSICIAIIKRKPPQALKRFTAYKVGGIGISWVTLAELEFAVAKSRHLGKRDAHRRIGHDDRGACPRPGRNARHQ
jgi:tRNA(fMet)-specific endonuclease VapC